MRPPKPTTARLRQQDTGEHNSIPEGSRLSASLTGRPGSAVFQAFQLLLQGAKQARPTGRVRSRFELLQLLRSRILGSGGRADLPACSPVRRVWW